jgi:hypothetical protein
VTIIFIIIIIMIIIDRSVGWLSMAATRVVCLVNGKKKRLSFL